MNDQGWRGRGIGEECCRKIRSPSSLPAILSPSHFQSPQAILSSVCQRPASIPMSDFNTFLTNFNAGFASGVPIQPVDLSARVASLEAKNAELEGRVKSLEMVNEKLLLAFQKLISDKIPPPAQPIALPQNTVLPPKPPGLGFPTFSSPTASRLQPPRDSSARLRVLYHLRCLLLLSRLRLPGSLRRRPRPRHPPTTRPP